MNTNSVQSMNPEFRRTAPLVRFVFAMAALSATLSVGGFIELLASDQVAQADAHRPVIVAQRR